MATTALPNVLPQTNLQVLNKPPKKGMGAKSKEVPGVLGKRKDSANGTAVHERGKSATPFSEAPVVEKKKADSDLEEIDEDVEMNMSESEMAEELLAKEKREAAGRAAFLEDKDEKGSPMPEEISALYVKAYPLVRTWWNGKGIPPGHRSSIEKLNQKITKINRRLTERIDRRKLEQEFDVKWQRKAKQGKLASSDPEALKKEKASSRNAFFRKNGARSDDQDHFPLQFIEGNIAGMARIYMELEAMRRNSKSNTSEYEEKAATLAQGAWIFCEQAANKLGMDGKRMVPSYLMEHFASFVGSTPERKAAFENFIAVVTKPNTDQEEALAGIASDIEEIGDIVFAEQYDKERMQVAIRKVEDRNERLTAINNKLDLPSQDHHLPIDPLKAIHEVLLQGNLEAMEDHVRNFKEMLTIQGYMALAQLMPGPPLSQTAVRNLLQGHSNSPDLFVPEDDIGNSSPATRNSVNMTDVGSNKDQLLEFGPDGQLQCPDDYGVMELMDYADGRTESGVVEGIRPTVSTNVRLGRFILNAGTEKTPYYTVMRGSDLPPGAAEALSDAQDLQTKFDLAKRKGSIRLSKSNPIQRIGPSCELPTSSSTGKRAHKAPMYFRVEYKKDKTQNSLAGVPGFPYVEWLTRTELIQLAGKKFTMSREDACRQGSQKRMAFMEKCKSLKVHPDTLEPLSAEDASESPWLFPSGAAASFKLGSEREEEDEDDLDMTGVEFDSGYSN